MGYMPDNVRKAIDEYKAEAAKVEARTASVKQRNAEFDEQLAKARRELDDATDRAIENPTETNIRKETEARKKVAELTLLVNGSDHRTRRAFQGGQDKLNALARQAIELAKAEAERYYNGLYDAKLKEIEEAKLAYLRALVGFRQFRNEAAAIYHDTLRETNPHLAEPLSGPNFQEPAIHYRGGRNQLYGVNEQEVELAFTNGIIRRWSVRDGAEIE